MNIKVRTSDTEKECTAWDEFVFSHHEANLYQLSGWKTIIEKTYGHKTYFLIATSDSPIAHSLSPLASNVVGILPLVHMKHLLFGNKLVSMPFFDMGGILADNEQTERALLKETLNLANTLKAGEIELRHSDPLKWLADSEQSAHSSQFIAHSNTQSSVLSTQHFSIKSNKVRMVLSLPDSSETLMASFKSKLRSQIKRPTKEGLHSKIGGLELIDDFYSVFSINMRDLGSPVHSKRMIINVLTQYPERARVVIVYKEDTPVACSLVLGFKDILANPWASSLREFSRLSPNMLLYWTMLEYACANGYKRFDFGRSTPDEGTYRFKAQWGAEPYPLHWHTLNLNGKPDGNVATNEKSKFSKAIQYWQKLPVPMTKALGPMLRKHISL